MSVSIGRSARASLFLVCALPVMTACDHDPVDPGDRSPAESGLLSVHTASTGRWIPEGDLQVWIDEDPESVHRVDLNGSREIVLPAGEHVVELFRGGGSPFPPACSVEGGRRREVTISPDRGALAEFELFCEVVLDLDISTTGVNPDPNGYRLLIGPDYVTYQGGVTVYMPPPNGSLTLDRDSPFWWDENRPSTYVLAWDVAPNCTVLGTNPLVFDTGGGVTRGEITVECVAPLPATGTVYYLDDIASQVARLPLDGSAPELITDGVRVHFFALSPDGTEIIFEPRADGSLNRVGVDGTGLTTIVPDQGYASHDLHWGSDGRLLFTRIDLSDYTSQVWSVNPDGSDLRQLTTGGGEHPVLSPDASTVAYRGPDGLMLMAPDGSNQRLVSGGIDLVNFAWSPDGSHLTGSLPGPTGYYEIVTVDPATGEVTTLASRPVQGLLDFAWSPDGRQLLFSAEHEGTDYPVDYGGAPDLFTVSAEGLNLAQLTTTGIYGRQFDWRE